MYGFSGLSYQCHGPVNFLSGSPLDFENSNTRASPFQWMWLILHPTQFSARFIKFQSRRGKKWANSDSSAVSLRNIYFAIYLKVSTLMGSFPSVIFGRALVFLFELCACILKYTEPSLLLSLESALLQLVCINTSPYSLHLCTKIEIRKSAHLPSH